jgi:hypothetical protein
MPDDTIIEDLLVPRQMFPTTSTRTTRTQRPVHTHLDLEDILLDEGRRNNMLTPTKHCTPFTLPSNGHLVINPTSTITLTTNVVFTPECAPTASLAAAFTDGGISGITDLKDPFHASVTPQAYATGAATVIAWMLCIMLMITPRTFFIGGAGGGFGMLNRHGMISGAQGSNSVIGVGSRPWLQKVAALTVAISLTIATADTFEVAERQYIQGFMNAEELRAEVVGSTEIKVSRVVSDIFLWLAQVQTLIRLFPRHKEKVLIKWIGFALIILDSTFSCMNSFMGNNVGSRPRRFRDAIPALSYLFQLALSMLYAAWVIYYSICKRRYAFYHKDMKNIFIVAFLSIIAILTPVVFFITDISNASVAGWGDYFRWVGAAAASVIVWEWVERIEALEREEKKDGILGREVFDGDEMLEASTSEEVIWPRRRRLWGRRGGDDIDDSLGGSTAHSSGQDQSMFTKSRNQSYGRGIMGKAPTQRRLSRVAENSDQTMASFAPAPYPTPPPAAVSPVSRTDTTSAASTVYTVRYHTIATPTPPVVRYAPHRESQQTPHQPSINPGKLVGGVRGKENNEKGVIETSDDSERFRQTRDQTSRFHINNPFKRTKAAPPAEILNAKVIDPVPISAARLQPSHNYPTWDIKGRLGAFAAEQGDKWREKRSGNQPEVDLPVTIIPANPRGRTWSPDTPTSQAITAVDHAHSHQSSHHGDEIDQHSSEDEVPTDETEGSVQRHSPQD